MLPTAGALLNDLLNCFDKFQSFYVHYNNAISFLGIELGWCNNMVAIYLTFPLKF